jgi:cupin fold WbuC family metalloprotein
MGLNMEDLLSLVGSDRLEKLFAAARESERRRSHLLLHAGHDDQVQRLLIAAQPETYVRPHYHSQQWEMLVLLRGRIDVLFFSDAGLLAERQVLTVASPVVQIPMSMRHGCTIAAPDTLVLEVKPGPYRPNEFIAGTPEEGSAGATALLSRMRDAPVGLNLLEAQHQN